MVDSLARSGMCEPGATPAQRQARARARRRRVDVSFAQVEALDHELSRLARGDGSLRLAIGEGLEALGCHSWHHELGFSSLNAYALERLELTASWVGAARALARRLAARPRLREALRSDAISWSMAELLSRCSTREDQDAWLALAEGRTVREVEAMVREAGRELDEPCGQDDLCTLTISVDREDAGVFECARWLVRRTSGSLAPDSVVDALLGEGLTSLLETLPGDARYAEPGEDPMEKARRAWAVRIAESRKQAEVLAEPDVRAQCAPTLRDAPGTTLPREMAADTATELDKALRDAAHELAERAVAVGQPY
jgi:hypothetical protein